MHALTVCPALLVLIFIVVDPRTPRVARCVSWRLVTSHRCLRFGVNTKRAHSTGGETCRRAPILGRRRRLV